MGDAHRWSGGRIFTGRSQCEALLVDDGRVVVAGTLDQARRASPTGTEHHDLGGGALIPGLIDAHLHLAEMALERRGVDARGASTIDALLDRVRRWAADHPRGPVVGRGWSLPALTESEWPTRHELDRAAADRPVVLFHASGHAAVVNSAALELLHVDRRTPDPPGGRLGRDAPGEPNGRLFESAVDEATPLAREALRAHPEILRGVIDELPGWGITAVGTMNTHPPELEILRTLDSTRTLSVRVRAYLGLRWFAGLADAEVKAAVAPGWRFHVVGVKGFADGAFGTRTALLSAPYADAASTSGMEVDSIEGMRGGFERARRWGLGAAAHALGDLGLDHALAAIEGRGPAALPAPDRIEHAGLVPPPQLARLARVRPIVVVQPIFLWSDRWLAERLGPQRIRWAYPFRSMQEAGLTLAGSSDAPFDAFDPWIGLRAATRRTDDAGKSANATVAETLDVESAFRIYTEGGARALGEPDLGTLVPGQSADLVRLAAPSLEAAMARGARAVQETWSAGVRTFARTCADSTATP